MPAARPTLYHLNTSDWLGGAEVYTHFLATALQRAGWHNVIVTNGSALWAELDVREGVTHSYQVLKSAALPAGAPVFIHAPVQRELLAELRRDHLVIGMAHQALYSDAMPAYYRAAHVLVSVSAHVSNTLRAAGLHHCHEQPLWGVAEVPRLSTTQLPVRGRLCEWDRRKLRDRVLAFAEPVVAAFGAAPGFERRTGLALGIVSRIAPLKQFPQLFSIIAPIIAEQQDAYLDVFGSAVGYAPLRDLRRALRPLRGRVRWWGFQAQVGNVYPQLDYLLTGLPEREALGLNVIEAQHCGVPVLAPDAPPFTETMVDGETGYLYADPRQDGGAGFRQALVRARERRPDPRRATAHLARFSAEAFAHRADAVVSELVRDQARWKHNE